MPGADGFLPYLLWLLMVLAALGLGFLVMVYRLQPLFLLPLAAGLLLGNLPQPDACRFLQPFLSALQHGLDSGLYVALIFLGWGAGVNLNPIIAHPRLLLLAGLTPLAFFLVLALGQFLGLSPLESAGIALIGGGDGLSATFLTAQVAPELSGPVSLAAFTLIGLHLRCQPYLVRLLTNRTERVLRMPPTRKVSRRESLWFALAGLILTLTLIPAAALLTGMFFLGYLVKESGIMERLGRTLANRLAEIVSLLLGLAVGSRCPAALIFTVGSLKIILLGLAALLLANVVVILAIKAINLLVSRKINPLVGAAALGLIPNAAHAAHVMSRREDPRVNLYPHALAASQAALLISTLTAGLLWSILGSR